MALPLISLFLLVCSYHQSYCLLVPFSYNFSHLLSPHQLMQLPSLLLFCLPMHHCDHPASTCSWTIPGRAHCKRKERSKKSNEKDKQIPSLVRARNNHIPYICKKKSARKSIIFYTLYVCKLTLILILCINQLSLLTEAFCFCRDILCNIWLLFCTKKRSRANGFIYLTTFDREMES